MHRVYAGVMEGNFEVFHDELAPNAELCICGFPPMSGTWTGPDTIINAIRGNFALVESLQTVLESMISDADRVAVLLRESGTLCDTGETYKVRFVQWFTFHDGKIAQLDQICAPE
jgi:ketosteroid isomerase-like protein